LHDLLPLSLAWLAYFAVHSLLASLGLKRRVADRYPGLMPAYRLVFNAVAVIGLVPVAWLVWRHPGPALWQWTGWQAWVANGLALASIAGFIASTRDYDSGEFLGLRQWRLRTRSVEDQERFHISDFHRYVRHPWYFFSLVLIWTRDMNAATLLSALMISAYFVVGSRFEERKLVVYHGVRYRRYMQRVAGLVPLPGKTLTRREADELTSA
jgi:protein-S-isoprenylcysteine O-methyltransferase Ste14